MKPSNSKKLIVAKETFKTLTPDQLTDVAGGTNGAPSDYTH